MNHLRELLDTATDSIGYDPLMPAPMVKPLISQCKSAAIEAQCFFMGDISKICELRPIPGLERMPYPTTWFEATDDRQRVTGMLASEASDGTISVACFGRVKGQWALFWVSTHVDLIAGTGRTFSNDPDVMESVQTGIFAIRAFCSAMHCHNVERARHTPDAALQKARLKRGKAPLFSYWTLELTDAAERGVHAGGTHASPRVHLRRGHFREFSPGKWTWVQPHAVGNKALGMVHKDYAATSGWLGDASRDAA
jgi:hypothetical protein